ncbi:hypothetical protein H0H92_009080 [Tricholoma furcatifolium]|nr:hypothetical protein H0H92_009080 [Tricholoma furcatifolium]
MPGKHVHFDGIPRTPSPFDVSPPAFNTSGTPYKNSPLPFVPSHIHHALSSTHTKPVIYYDLSLPPSNASFHHSLPDNTMFQMATNPPLPYMIIKCPAFPGGAIRVDGPQGVSIMDVFNAIYTTLRGSASQAEFERLPRERQQKVSAAYYRRYSSIPNEKARAMEEQKGLKRVDMLEERRMFGGLRSTMEGPEVWELCVVAS